MESKKLIDYGTLEWFDCKNNFPPMHIDLYVDSEHGYGIGRLGKRVKDGSTIWVVHLDSGEVYLVYAFYKVKRWAYMPKEGKKSELKAYKGDICAYWKMSECNAVNAMHETEEYAMQLYKELRHNKYKRCLAMASKCRLRARWFGDNAFYKKEQWALKWHRRWLELAEKFKEGK